MTTETTTDLLRALIEHMRGAPENWRTLSIVVELRDGRVGTTYGFTYSPDGDAAAVASRPSGILPAVQAYLAEKYADDAPQPLKFLVQFNRDTGVYEVVFEDTDAERWRVTPANIDTAPQELKPEFA